MRRHHHYHSPWRRGAYSFALVASVMVIGTLGIHLIERMSYLNAFYFMSMIATAQGPAATPLTSAGKVFTSIMAFISVGTVIAALGFLFGPFFGTLWNIGVKRLEEERQGHQAHDKEQLPR